MPNAAEGTTQRARNKWGEGSRLRSEILDAASRLLSELGGEDGLSIRGVARAVGIAPASIYQHFADRSALVRGLLEHEYQRLHALVEQADGQVDAEDVVGRVHAQLYAYCDFAVAHPGHYRLMLGAARHSPGERPLGPLMDIVHLFTDAFERCQQAGHQLRLPSDRAAVMVFVGTHGRVALLHSNPTERTATDLRPFIDELVSLVFA